MHRLDQLKYMRYPPLGETLQLCAKVNRRLTGEPAEGIVHAELVFPRLLDVYGVQPVHAVRLHDHSFPVWVR